MYKILKFIFKKCKPFSFDFELMEGKMFIIGIRFNKFYQSGLDKKCNSLGLFYGYKYKVFSWVD